MTTSDKKISILGCGWLGMPTGTRLTELGYTVKGSTTRTAQIGKLALSGILPYVVQFHPANMPKAEDSFFDCSVLIVTLPPPVFQGVSDYHLLVHRKIASIADQRSIERVIVISSTSVYEDHAGEVVEDDATYVQSVHSGISLLAIEECYQRLGSKVTILRSAGQVGPGRHPGRFLSSKSSISSSESPVNMVHLDDLIGAIEFTIQHDLVGTFNVCAPVHQTACSFYAEAFKSLGFDPLECDGIKNKTKEVSSAKLLAKGFSYRYPDLLDWLKQ